MFSGSGFSVSRKDSLPVIFLFLFALIVRLLYLRQYSLTQAYPFLPYSDSYFYYLRALDINSGDFLNWKIFISWPLYSYLLAFLLKAGHNSVALAYAFQNILGALQCVLIYFIGRALCSRLAGLFAALFFSCYGMSVFYDNLLIYTCAALFLNSLFFLFVLSIFRRDARPRRLFMAGIFLGVCTAMQAGAAVFGLMALLWVSWTRGNGLSSRLRLCLSSICGFVLIISAVTGMNYASDKAPVILSRNAGFNFYLGNNPQATGSYYTPALFTPNQEALYNEAKGMAQMRNGRQLSPGEVSRYWAGESLGFIFREPLNYLRLLGRKAVLTFSPKEAPCDPEYKFAAGIFPISGRFTGGIGIVIPLALIGVFLARRLGKELVLLYLAVLGFALNTTLFFVISKNRIMMVPFLAVFAGISLHYLRGWLVDKRYLKAAILAGVAVILYFSLRYFCPEGNNTSVVTNTVAGYFHNGVVCVKNADYGCALREFNSALQLDPGNPRIMFSLGTVYYELRDYKKAEEEFKRALEAAPFYADAYYNLGYMYNRLGRYKDAVAVLDEGLGYMQDDPGLYFELACAYDGLREFGQAKTVLVSALAKIRRWQPEKKSAIELKLKEIEDASAGNIPGGADGSR